MTSCSADRLETLELLSGTLSRAMAAHWSFDETEGAVLHDQSGNQHHGTVTGAQWIPGRLGGALHFRRGDYVTVPAFPDATPDWTVAVWVRVASSDLGYGYIAVVSAEAALTGGWELNMNDTLDDMRYHFGYFTGPGSYEYAYWDCRCLEPDRWIHVAAVVDSRSGALYFYRDGKLEHAEPITRTILPGASDLTIGRWTTEPRFFAGDLDDISIYARALSASEIAVLARQPAEDPVLEDDGAMPVD